MGDGDATMTDIIIAAILLQILLIILKISGAVTWNWGLVLLPLIVCGGATLILFICVVVIIICNSDKDF